MSCTEISDSEGVANNKKKSIESIEEGNCDRTVAHCLLFWTGLELVIALIVLLGGGVIAGISGLLPIIISVLACIGAWKRRRALLTIALVLQIIELVLVSIVVLILLLAVIFKFDEFMADKDADPAMKKIFENTSADTLIIAIVLVAAMFIIPPLMMVIMINRTRKTAL